ncbi:hypothetical protein SAMD00019534_066850 [Acytostelium subglobosum LB1]|uniref:hypothetical protein n=1 Tax=Acytostelium subglobosum LB1 TaxID=1410327 RepID=UPI000644C384|nr:hypothetical protein SAMD00019534_066850 [Acytostelium subglobosum LB1]GAM23510.1 hypothetical protein SAMD00019534_066850 [Acytostelium subglobosum LB1]|eukprot:XP_012753251.1 hypothetical protein SAMD00019534_066850 [Acytostelium subglobosum LB1]
MEQASKYAYIGDDEYEEMDIDNDIHQLNEAPAAAPAPPAPPTRSGLLSSIFGRGSSSSKGSSVSSAPPAPPMPPTSTSNVSKKIVSRKLVKKANTNVLNINLGTLSSDPTVATGDPLYCKGCKVIYSNINNFKQVKTSDGKTVPNVPTAGGVSGGKWTCEFCGEITTFTMSEEEIPKSNMVDYIIEPAPVSSKPTSGDDSMVIFCVDISGSMQCTSEVPKELKLRAGKGEKNTSRYVSRLQCVQYGIEEQLQALEEASPGRRVAIVAFNGSVNIVGDGSQSPIVVTGDKLDNMDQLLEAGSSYKMNSPISKTRQALVKKVFELDAEGSTALGPAITVCVGMASKVPGSKIVLATDGLSNIGIGSVENSTDNTFYESIGAIAQKNGTTISVLTIKGTDTKLEQIGLLSELTSGTVDIVDPLKMQEEFKSVLSLPVLATNVAIQVKLHRGLYISDPSNPSTNESHIHKEIGNVNEDTVVSFEYGMMPNKKLDPALKSIPFQLQISYTTMSGMKCVRVMTMTQETTSNQELADEHANIDALGVNMVQTTSKIASKGDYNQSRAKNMQTANLLNRVATKKKQTHSAPSTVDQDAGVWLNQAQMLETHLTTAIQKESGGGSDDEEEEHRPERYERRKLNRSDETANVLFNMKSMNVRKAKK